MAITDTAVGAILEIPTQALKGIKDAERAIWALHDASKKAADQVYGDFGERIPRAFDKFIQKIREASGVIDGINGKTVNINMTGMEQSMTQAANTAQTQSQRISEAVARLAYSDIDFSNFKQLDAVVKSLGLTYQNLEKDLKAFNAQLIDKKVYSEESQTINNKIEALREYIRIKKMSESRQTTATTALDRDYLAEQKKILNDILNIRKQLNAEQIAGARKAQTGADTSAERENINKLLAQLREANAAYRELNRTKYESLSAKGQADAENNVLRQELALLKEATSAREKLNQTITRGTELANQAKLKSAGLGSSEDAIYQRTLTGLYQEQIKVLRDIGRVRADVASEGRRASDSEIDKLTLLAEKYRTLQTAIGNMSGKYTKIDQNAQSNFNAERDRQIIENAILKEQAERKYQETLAKTQHIIAGKFDMSATLESLGRFRQEEQMIHDQLVRLQNLIRQLQSERIDIQFNMKADFAKQIAPLNERLRELRKLTQQPLGTDKLREYYREIDILKEKIATLTAAARIQSASNPALVGNQEQIAALVTRYNALEAELQKVGGEANKLGQTWLAMNEANKALDAQSQRILALEQRLRNLNAIWERLKATNQAFDSTGKLTDKGQRLVNLQNEVSEEIRLRKMTASEAKRYEEQKTRDTESESNKRIAKAKKEAQETKDALAAQKKIEIGNPLGAINYAKNATTLNQLTDAYKNLQAVMNRTDPKSSDWDRMNTQLKSTKTQIDDIKKKMGEFHNEVQKTSNIMGNLQSRIAAAFSVGAIMGFAKKVTEVRAQFELQRVALGAIIQDKDEANKVFLRVQQMALESPFSIMQLERSTKQIAAFGFEAKQLVPTMKMVADIGAGLGVELDRIVLVLGHMKARGYLEGTMVRQFTNMGFNVLGELAKYYTELEGRMVSVADVQERVKKKMVEFGDVEEVLKRVTSAGGMFYDMQKKQSDSIWGQMQRITDAYDLMLNEIGQSNEGSIKAALTAVRTLINSWRTLLPLIKAAGAAMVLYFAVSKWGAITTGLALATSGFRVLTAIIRNAASAQRLFNAEQMATGWGTLVALIGAAVVAIWEFATAQSKLNEELERTQSEGISDMYGLIFQYRTLADTVKDSTKSYDERKKALDEINRVYKDILPDYMTEIEYIKSIKDGYEEATEAIKAYSEAKIRKNMKEAVENEYGKQIQDAIANNAERFTDNVYDAFSNLPQLEKIDRDTFKGAVSNIMTGIAEEVKAGALPIEKASDELQKRVLATFNISKDDFAKVSKDVVFGLNTAFKSAFGDVNTWWSDMFGFGMKSGLKSVIMDMNKEMGKITNLGITSTVMDENAQPTIDQYHNLEKAVAEYTSALEALYNRKAELEKQGKTFGTVGIGDVDGKQTFTFPGADSATQDAMDEVHHKVYLLQQAISAYGYEYKVNMDEINRAIQSNMDMTEFMGTVNQNVLGNILKGFQKWGGEIVNNPYMANFVETALKNLNLLTEPQKRIIDIAKKVATANGVAMNTFDLLKISAAASYTDAAKEAKKLSDQAADNIKKIAQTRTQLLLLAKLNHQILTTEQAQQQAEQMFGGGKTEEQLKSEQKAYEQLWKALGGYEKSNKKSSGSKSDKELKRWQDLKKAIEEVQTAYDKARKSFSVEESNRQIEKLFGPTFKELGVNIKDFYKDGTYDAESLIKALDVLLGMTKATTEERKKFRSELQRSKADTQVEIDVKAKEDSEKKLKADLGRLFDSYDLSKTLKDANIPINLVPMVGGEPIASLDELRDRIQKQFEAEGGENASENRVKEYKDALKKIDDMEVKQQQERLKSYQQYLAVMYSDRAQTMIKSYTTMKNMERDFAAYRANLEKEAADPATTEARKQQIAQQIATLEQQSKDAIAGVKNEMDQKLNQFDWNAFKGSPVFTQMYSDLQTLSKQGIDMLIGKLTVMREKLQSMENVDFRAVREITQYINKLNDARIDTASWKELFDIVQESRSLNAQGKDMETAEENLMGSQMELDSLNAMIDDLQTVIALKDKEGEESVNTANLTADQLALYGESKDDLQAILKATQKNAAAAQGSVDEWSKIIDKHKQAQAALKRQIAITKTLQDEFNGVHDACVEVAEALGEDTDIWGNFAKSVGNLIFTAITLTLQFQLMGIAANSSLGIIGWIAIALQVIANLLVAIFAAHDKSLQKRIEEQQAKVEQLERAYDKLKDAVDSAFEAERLRSDSRKAVQNIKDRIKATEEMIRLEEQKKKVDKDQIKEWKEDIEDLNDELDEFKDNVTEAWGGFGSDDNYQSAVEDFTSAWLDAFNETGDGLDALNDKWDEYIDNLIKKQIGLAVMGPRIKRFMKMIDSFVGEGSDEAEYLSKSELDQLKALRGSLLDGINEEMKLYLEALGYTSKGETVLSDLQKGIQNITEPQAAAIEAYLNSMRFAVFRHTEQLDMLIQMIGMQYGTTADNPVVNELKGIRMVLDSIDSRLDSVIKYDMGIAKIQVV